MLKKITVDFTYDGSPQGDIDRDALETTWNSEITKDTVVPMVSHGANVENSSVQKTGDIITAVVFYIATNAGLADFNSFWSSIQTEFAKSTVVKVDYVSQGNKHDCYHDSQGGCKSFTYLA